MSGSTAHELQSVYSITSMLSLSTLLSSMQCQPVLSHRLIHVQPAAQSPHFVADPHQSSVSALPAARSSSKHTFILICVCGAPPNASTRAAPWCTVCVPSIARTHIHNGCCAQLEDTTRRATAPCKGACATTAIPNCAIPHALHHLHATTVRAGGHMLQPPCMWPAGPAPRRKSHAPPRSARAAWARVAGLEADGLGGHLARGRPRADPVT